MQHSRVFARTRGPQTAPTVPDPARRVRWWKGFYRLGEAYMRLGRYEDAHAVRPPHLASLSVRASAATPPPPVRSAIRWLSPRRFLHAQAFQRSFSCRSCPSDRCPELIKKLSEARRKAESSAGARDGGVGYASLAAGAEGYAELAEAGEAMKHGRWADVLVALDACAARDGGADAQSAHAKAMRAAAHMRLDDAPRALRAADAALQLNPLLRGARAVRARALAALQRHHEALACLDALEAIEAEPLACGAAPAGGGADGALPGGGEDEFCAAARAKAEAGVAELAGLDAEAAKARGNAAFNAGAFQEAIECYSAALGLRPNWAVRARRSLCPDAR
jgi:tetratricopeptide (TPR) repeat protein